MDIIKAKQFADEWVRAWNDHDIEQVLSHYVDDFEMTTPMIQKVLGIPDGTMKGKDKIRQYWKTALLKVPELKFEIVDVTCGVDTVSIYYKSVLGKMAIETLFFNPEGKVIRALACYT